MVVIQHPKRIGKQAPVCQSNPSMYVYAQYGCQENMNDASLKKCLLNSVW